MGDLIIRKAVLPDAETMAELDKICFADPWSTESFRSEIETNNRSLYQIAEMDGVFAGYAGLWKILDEGHITNVAVAPEFRRRGIGEAMLTRLIELAEAEDIMKFTLEVRISNLQAQALYEKLGFEPAGLRKGYYLDNREDAVIMWRGERQE
ncbi:MAG: ribosomal protein S18-alanine N-acetyltransferase [Clostridia bacterium]|nr:ribosomal protein S18-alanine N-acetyltransferase [Clostridia bacterium]